MKSPRQKRAEREKHRAAKSARAAKYAKRDQAEAALRFTGSRAELGGTAPVNEKLLAPDGSYGRPGFVKRGYYEDADFVCRDCGVTEVWKATQQKWWYEIARGGVWTTALRCRPCRRKERERVAKARDVHLAGVARKNREKEKR